MCKHCSDMNERQSDISLTTKCVIWMKVTVKVKIKQMVKGRAYTTDICGSGRVSQDLIQLQELWKRPKCMHNVKVHGSSTYHYSYSKPVWSYLKSTWVSHEHAWKCLPLLDISLYICCRNLLLDQDNNLSFCWILCRYFRRRRS